MAHGGSTAAPTGTSAGGRSLQCLVVTPETTLLDERCEFVVLPLFDGEIGIAPLHSPMIGRLGVGEMRLRQGETVRRFYVEGGFVEVVNDTVAVLTNHAIAAETLDPTVLEKSLEALTTEPVADAAAEPARRRKTTHLKSQLKVARKAREKKL